MSVKLRNKKEKKRNEKNLNNFLFMLLLLCVFFSLFLKLFFIVIYAYILLLFSVNFFKAVVYLPQCLAFCLLMSLSFIYLLFIQSINKREDWEMNRGFLLLLMIMRVARLEHKAKGYPFRYGVNSYFTVKWLWKSQIRKKDNNYNANGYLSFLLINP